LYFVKPYFKIFEDYVQNFHQMYQAPIGNSAPFLILGRVLKKPFLILFDEHPSLKGG